MDRGGAAVVDIVAAAIDGFEISRISGGVSCL